MKVQRFPTEINFPKLEERIDPDRPYAPLFTGLYLDAVGITGTDSGSERFFLTWLPETVQTGDRSIFIAVPSEKPSGDPPEVFLEKSGWLDIAATYRLFLFAFLPESGRWRTDEPDEEVAYMAAAFNRITGVRPFYNMVLGNHYFAGYGDGGSLLHRFVLSHPTNCAGATFFDGCDIPMDVLTATAEKPSEDPDVPLRHVKMPVWLINGHHGEQEQRILDYWAEANDCDDEIFSNDLARTRRQRVSAILRGLNEQTVSRVWWSAPEAGTGEVPGYRNPAFNETVWTRFLQPVSRFNSNIHNRALRPTVSFDDIGVTRHEVVLDGFRRHWYEYVPSRPPADDAGYPLLFAFHGLGQTGGIMVHYSEWHKIAEEHGFVVVYPTAYMIPIADGGPLTGWNLGTDINAVNDVEFVRTILNDVESRVPINGSRRYLSGQSYGSSMTNYLAMILPREFAAAGSTSGPIFRTNRTDTFLGIGDDRFTFPDDLDERYEMPVWLILGENDMWNGGSLRVNRNARGTIEYWLRRNGAGSAAGPLVYRSGIHHHQVWKNGAGVPMVRYSITAGRGHNATPEEYALLWTEHFSRYSRGLAGEVQYMQGNDVLT